MTRTLTGGRKAGVISGLGAALSDTFYGAVAAFSITFIIQALIRQEFWIRLAGGILLIGIGIRYWFKRPKPLAEQRPGAVHSELVTTFLLNFSNPTVALSFLAVLAVLRLTSQDHWWQNTITVAGIFAGGMLWWITLALITNHFRERFHRGAMLWMNRIAGVAIAVFGIITIILSFTSGMK